MSGDEALARRAGLIGPDGTTTPRYAQYLVHQRQHQAALVARDEAYARALRDPRALQQWPMTGRAYQDAVDDAFDRWLALGHKREVEAALDALRTPAPAGAGTRTGTGPSTSTGTGTGTGTTDGCRPQGPGDAVARTDPDA